MPVGTWKRPRRSDELETSARAVHPEGVGGQDAVTASDRPFPAGFATLRGDVFWAGSGSSVRLRR
jgi:hypothetical protein